MESLSPTVTLPCLLGQCLHILYFWKCKPKHTEPTSVFLMQRSTAQFATGRSKPSLGNSALLTSPMLPPQPYHFSMGTKNLWNGLAGSSSIFQWYHPYDYRISEHRWNISAEEARLLTSLNSL